MGQTSRATTSTTTGAERSRPERDSGTRCHSRSATARCTRCRALADEVRGAACSASTQTDAGDAFVNHATEAPSLFRAKGFGSGV